MVTKKLVIEMWQLKNGNKKCGDQKLMIKNVVIETCHSQNSWQLNSCGD
jgi:hypothetical protein